MNWISALKEYNKDKKWVVPKKGTPEYDEVRKIMDASGTSGGGVCSDKPNISEDRKDSRYTCFKKGIRTGVYLRRQQEEKQREEEKNQRPNLEEMTLRALGDLARNLNREGKTSIQYSRMNKQALITALSEYYNGLASSSEISSASGDGLFSKREVGVLPPQSRQLLQKIGNEPISSIKIVRTPLNTIINKILNAVSLGAFKSSIQSLGYDKLFHLTLLINDKYTFEKDEVVRLRQRNPLKSNSEVMSVPVPPALTINTLIENTKQRMGADRFSNYDARRNNCQDFLLNILAANNIAGADQFIKQDAEAIFQKMPKWVDKFSKLATDVAAVGSRLIEGEDVSLEKKKKFR